MRKVSIGRMHMPVCKRGYADALHISNDISYNYVANRIHSAIVIVAEAHAGALQLASGVQSSLSHSTFL